MASIASQSIRRAQVQTRPGNRADCQYHPGVKVVFVCLNSGCHEQLACTKCVSTNHRAHNLEDLTKFAANKREELKKYIQNAKCYHLKGIKHDLKKIDQKISLNEDQSKENVLMIFRKSQTLQKELQDLSAKHAEMCTGTAESNLVKLTQHKACLNQFLMKYQLEIEDLENICNSVSDIEVILKDRSLSWNPEPHPPIPEIEDLQKYEPTKVPNVTKYLQYAMGVSCDLPSSSSPNCLASFEVPGEGGNNIKYLCPMMDQILVWFWNSRRVSIFNKCGLMTHSVQFKTKTNGENFDISQQDTREEDGDSSDEEYYPPQHKADETEMVDIFVSPVDFSIWFCCSDGEVWQRENNGQCQMKFNANQQPTAVCISHSGHIILGTTKCNVVLYSHDGNIINTSADLEWCPRKITQCPKSKNFAILQTNSYIDIVDQSLTTVFMFDPSSQLPCCPSKPVYRSEGICFDTNGNLFIADQRNQNIIMLDSKGKYNALLAQENNETFYPHAVSVICEGYMWVAYRSPVINKNSELVKTRKVLKLVDYSSI